MNFILALSFSLLVSFIIYSGYLIPVTIEDVIEAKNEKASITMDVTKTEIVLANGTSQLIETKIENQTYVGDFIVKGSCEPSKIGNIIITNDCDLLIEYMQISELLNFFKENPDALTNDQEDILLSKAVGNQYGETDKEIDKKAEDIMWRLIADGLY